MEENKTELKNEENLETNVKVEEKTVDIENNNKVEKDVTTSDNQNNNKENKKNDKKKSPFKIIGKIINILLWIIIILFAGILVLTLASQKTDVLGFRIYTIMSGSMEPTIHVEDVVVTKKVDEAKVGDVIAFKYGQSITVHRIIEEYNDNNGKSYLTQGDNNNAPDQHPIKQEDVKGKVVVVIHKLGHYILYLQSHFVAVIIICGVLIFLIVLVTLLRRLI